MQRIQANSHLLCNSCHKELGFIRHNVNVAQFIYCDECVKAQKFHSDYAFLQTWDKDIFHEPLADFSLQGSDGGILRAHKAVLAGKSKVFKAMLTAGMSESANGKVKITEMTAAELRPFLNFLYTGNVNQRSLECHAVALYKASHKYDLPLLTAICDRFLASNVFRDVRGVFELAVNHGLEKFQEAVLPYIFSQGFVESNPPPLVLKTLREASQFDCFPAYRKKCFKDVSFLMELCLYRIADHLNVEDKGMKEEYKNDKGVEEENEIVVESRCSNESKFVMPIMQNSSILLATHARGLLAFALSQRQDLQGCQYLFVECNIRNLRRQYKKQRFNEDGLYVTKFELGETS